MSGLSQFFSSSHRLNVRWRFSVEDHVIAAAYQLGGGSIFAAASVSGPIALLDARTGDLRHALAGHGFGTVALAWSPDGKTLASAGQDGKIRFWDSDSGRERATLDGGGAWVERLAWSHGSEASVLASSAGRRLRFWNAGGDLIGETTDHPSTISAVAWHPQELQAAVAAYGRVTLWDPRSDVALRTFEWKGSHLTLEWSPDGRHIATGDQDATVHFWILKTGEDLQMSGYATKVRELAWDASSRYLATGGSPLVTIWDVSGRGPAGTTPITLDGHADLISALAFQRKGKTLASGGLDGCVNLWRPGKSTSPVGRVALNAGIACLAWAPDDRTVTIGTEEGEVVALDVV
jgi:WD40 repeat protein